MKVGIGLVLKNTWSSSTWGKTIATSFTQWCYNLSWVFH